MCSRPAWRATPRPIHQLAIVALGLPLVDVMDLEAAAETAGAPLGIPVTGRGPVPGGTASR